MTSLALCATARYLYRVSAVGAVDAPRGTQSQAAITATCPTGTVVLGGGALASPAGSTSFKPIGSYPSTADGTMVADGARTPRSWTAVGSTGGNADPAAVTTAYAICALPLGARTTVTRVDAAGPPASSTSATVSASCPAGSTLVGGGVNVDNPGGMLQGGIHLRGSYPSTATGAPAAGRRREDGRSRRPASLRSLVAAAASTTVSEILTEALARHQELTRAPLIEAGAAQRTFRRTRPVSDAVMIQDIVNNVLLRRRDGIERNNDDTAMAMIYEFLIRTIGVPQ